MARILAFDHGTRRLGVAFAETDAGVATGRPTILYEGRRDLRSKLEELVADAAPNQLLVGLPIGMDGSSNERCGEAERFASRLEGWFGLPVTLWDERLTSAQARRIQREAEVSDREARARGLVDRAAAVLLLQSWLDHRKAETESPA